MLITTKFQEFTALTSGRYILVPRDCILEGICLAMTVNVSVATEDCYCYAGIRLIDNSVEMNTIQADREGMLGILRAGGTFNAGGTFALGANQYFPLRMKVFSNQRINLLAASLGSAVDCNCIAYFGDGK